jgi:hypothetical protein
LRVPDQRRLRRLERRRVGERVAALLSGAWREPAPPLTVTIGPDIVPWLLGGAVAPLVWRRIAASTQTRAPAAEPLRNAHRLGALNAALHDEEVARAFDRLHGAGVEPLLGKGWAAARLYPDPGLRPYGDIDLYFPRRLADAARSAMRDPDGPACSVDLHPGFGELDDRTDDAVASRATTVRLDGREIRLLGPEDHLRLLCLHAMRHGVLRPLWLCDIAAAIEGRPPTFNWDYFWTGDPVRTQWVRVALTLARTLLGAEGLPAQAVLPALPGWLRRAVLEEWGAGRPPQGTRRPMREALRGPIAFIRALQERWPNGIEATVGVRGTFGPTPRFPYQVAESIRRAALFALSS